MQTFIFQLFLINVQKIDINTTYFKSCSLRFVLWRWTKL